MLGIEAVCGGACSWSRTSSGGKDAGGGKAGGSNAGGGKAAGGGKVGGKAAGRRQTLAAKPGGVARICRIQLGRNRSASVQSVQSVSSI
eukprot:gene10928-biopygen5591